MSVQSTFGIMWLEKEVTIEVSQEHTGHLTVAGLVLHGQFHS